MGKLLEKQISKMEWNKLIIDFCWSIIILFWIISSLSTIVNNCFPLSVFEGMLVIFCSATVYAFRNQSTEDSQKLRKCQ